MTNISNYIMQKTRKKALNTEKIMNIRKLEELREGRDKNFIDFKVVQKIWTTMYILTLLYYGDGSEKRHKISVSLHELRNRGVRVEVGRVWSDIVSLHTYRHKFLLRPFKYTIEKKGGGGGEQKLFNYTESCEKHAPICRKFNYKSLLWNC